MMRRINTVSSTFIIIRDENRNFTRVNQQNPGAA